MTDHTRRSVLKIAGASLAAATVPAVAYADEEHDWTVAETPVDSTLHGVAHTATVPHAVGSGGLVIARTSAGWELVLDGGPTGNGNDLYGLDADAFDDVTVSGGNATIQSYDGSQWTPESLGDTDLVDVETDGDDGYTVGGGGVIFEQSGGVWEQNTTPVGENMTAVARGDVDLAVGADGTVLER